MIRAVRTFYYFLTMTPREFYHWSLKQPASDGDSSVLPFM